MIREEELLKKREYARARYRANLVESRKRSRELAQKYFDTKLGQDRPRRKPLYSREERLEMKRVAEKKRREGPDREKVLSLHRVASMRCWRKRIEMVPFLVREEKRVRYYKNLSVNRAYARVLLALRKDGKMLEDYIAAQNISVFGCLTCYLCGKPIIGTGPEGKVFRADWHLEHKVPLMQGGSNVVENLGVAHPKCNRVKGRMSVDQFRKLEVVSL
jgi:5-methylcytosine-specific restriction endonuclease McrA